MTGYSSGGYVNIVDYWEEHGFGSLFENSINGLAAFEQCIAQISQYPGILHDSNNRGGLIFLPPGTYRIGPFSHQPGDLTLEPTLVIPYDVTLVFAPGAIIVPDTNVVVLVIGQIDAGLHQIFATPSSASSDGRIVLGGSRILEVFPEWWGAQNGPVDESLRDDTRALQATIDAAFHNRLVHPSLTRGSFPRAEGYKLRPPIPIRLTGLYLISSPLLIGRPSTNPLPLSDNIMSERNLARQVHYYSITFVLRGSHSNGRTDIKRATIQCRENFNGPRTIGDPMLRITGPQGFQIERVDFDAGGFARACVELGADDNAPSQGNSFRHCSFRGGRVEQVSVGPFDSVIDLFKMRSERDVTPVIPIRASPQGSNAGLDFLILLFESCRFEVEGADSAPTSKGMRYRSYNTVPMHLSNCIFIGSAKAMIHATSGIFQLTSCSFYNRATGLHAEESILEGAEIEPTGTDIFLGKELLSPLAPGSLVPVIRPGDTVPSTSLISLEPGGFVAINCDSYSRRFLSTYTPTGLVRRRFGQNDQACIVLINVRQTSAISRSAVMESPPIPAVFYNLYRISDVTSDEEASQLVQNQSFVMLGCHFDGPIELGSDAKIIVDVATSFSSLARRNPNEGFLFASGDQRLFRL